jgi:hypothetical protein
MIPCVVGILTKTALLWHQARARVLEGLIVLQNWLFYRQAAGALFKHRDEIMDISHKHVNNSI